MLYVKDRNLKYIKAKKQLALQFGVRKSQWKKNKLSNKLLKRDKFPFDKEWEYCMKHLKYGKGESKKYLQYFKNLEIENFINYDE